jgi:hypothetical protein
LDPRDLFDDLLHAEHETEVLDTLANRGLMDLSNWHYLGDLDNNFGIVANQQQDATGAVVEKIINSLDANLMRACFEAGVDPEGPDAPASMAAAVEKFFDVPKGRVGDLTTPEQRRLAEMTQFVAVGSKTDPSYLIIDLGEGQTPQKQPQTFLSIAKSNKMRIPFVQGKFNAGGTGVLPFCGQHNLQLVISKRHPRAPISEDDNTAGRWGFTVIRRLRPSESHESTQGGEGQPPRSSVYVYLAPDGKVFSFSADSILALPAAGKANQPSQAYEEPLEWGSVVKLYNYRWARKSIATTDARYELERFLHSPCLPFRVVETRDYRAHYYSTTVVGIWADIAVREADPEKARVDPGFPASASMNLAGIGELPYTIALFQEGTEMKRVPHGIHFVVNGQSHGQLPADFITGRLKFPYLSDELLVSVDCTGMEENAREDFFMASRDRLRRNDTYYRVVDSLAQDLHAHPGLRQANAARRAKLLEKSLGQQEDVANTLNELLSADPALQALFSIGDRLVSRVGPTEVEKYTGKRFPTYFRLEDEPKSGLIKSCPVNRTCRVEFVTDAVNDYFSRGESPGVLTISPGNVFEHRHLWNGVCSARFRPPDGSKPGQVFNVVLEVTDPQREELGRPPFRSSFTLKTEKELVITTRPGPQPSPKKPNKNGKEAPRLSMPNVVSVRQPEWEQFKPPFDADQAFRVISGEEDNSFDFYLNLDCKHLIGYLRTTKDDEHDLVRHWFKWGLTLCALGLLHGYGLIGREPSPNGAAPPSDEPVEGNNDDERKSEAIKAVNRSVNGLGTVIIPIIKNLYHPLVTSKA